MSVFIFLTVIAFLLLLILSIFHYSSKGRNYWLTRNVPYREPCPIFGNFAPMFMMKKSYSKMLQEFYDNFKNEQYVGMFQARRPTLMLIDYELVKNVMSTQFSNFTDRMSVNTDTNREPLLRNVSNMSGAEWKAMRHIITPAFSSAKMKAMFPLIVECTENLRAVLIQNTGNEIDVANLMVRFTTDLIGSCAFGVNPGSLKDPDSPFLKMAQRMFRTSRSAILKRYCRTFSPRLFKLLNLKTYPEDVEMFFTSIITRVLDERRTTGAERKDFLQLLLNEQKTNSEFQMTDALITSNSFIFMLAGLETSATNLSFMLYELAKHQDIQERIRVEVNDCLEQYKGLTYEAVCAMQFTLNAACEALRLHPSTPLTTRVCTEACTISGTDLRVKTKENLIIPIHCIQKDERYFPDPDKFDPERFSETTRPAGFLAFGDGPRSCPGERFSHLAVVAAVAVIVKSFSVESCSRTTPRIEYDTRSVMLKNKGGIWLQFNKMSMKSE